MPQYGKSWTSDLIAKPFGLSFMIAASLFGFAARAAQSDAMQKQGASRPHPAFETAPDWPAPGQGSASIAEVVSTFYEAISAAPGQHLDRHRLKSLFTPDGRIAFVQPIGSNRTADVVYLTPDQYADSYERVPDPKHAPEGFYDRVLANQVVQFGDMAHVWGSYESRHALNDAKPFARGIKSIDLLRHRGNWYILQVFFERESGGTELPRRFLRKRT